ncbi:hypothetical protein G6F31_017928 [Rhizopus arrhizus]|nr:hypothetical protein G6F31_017928 [Rhizopus arrhizus]
MEAGDGARARHEGFGVFGVDAALDGVAGEHHVALLDRQLLAGGDLQLLGHQVDAGDHFGDRMLHLDAGVHFNEIELAVLDDDASTQIGMATPPPVSREPSDLG